MPTFQPTVPPQLTRSAGPLPMYPHHVPRLHRPSHSAHRPIHRPGPLHLQRRRLAFRRPRDMERDLCRLGVVGEIAIFDKRCYRCVASGGHLAEELVGYWGHELLFVRHSR